MLEGFVSSTERRLADWSTGVYLCVSNVRLAISTIFISPKLLISCGNLEVRSTKCVSIYLPRAGTQKKAIIPVIIVTTDSIFFSNI